LDDSPNLKEVNVIAIEEQNRDWNQLENQEEDGVSGNKNRNANNSRPENGIESEEEKEKEILTFLQRKLT
jgi:hypothetical protein